MKHKLSQHERSTLNEALAIIHRHTPLKASWHLGPHNYHGTPGCFATYFDSRGGQHDGLSGATFADRIQAALDFERRVQEGEEHFRAKRIESLRKQLANLEQETA